MLSRPSWPERLVCPITLCEFDDPVLSEDGYTYERNNIKAYLNTGDIHNPPKSPVTRENVHSKTLIPNTHVKLLAPKSDTGKIGTFNILHHSIQGTTCPLSGDLIRIAMTTLAGAKCLRFAHYNIFRDAARTAMVWSPISDAS